MAALHSIHTQYVSPREETGGCHGDMARQPLVHSHKNREKSLASRQTGKGEDTQTFFFGEIKCYAKDAAFCVTTALIFFLADLSVGNKCSASVNE